MPIAERLRAYQYLLVLVPTRLCSRRNETSPECRSRGCAQRQQSIRLQTILRRRLEERCEVRSRSKHYLSNYGWYGCPNGSAGYHSHTLIRHPVVSRTPLTLVTVEIAL